MGDRSRLRGRNLSARARRQPGQVATLLADAYGLEAEHGPPFDDVDRDHPHAEGIAALPEHDVAEGFDEDTYRPDDPVTRAQMTAFLVRADPQL